eukprot:PITA_35832
MIESVRTIILQSECLEYETSSEAFFTAIHDILVNKWDKNCTPLHCLAHSLNPKCYNHEGLNGGPSRRFPPHINGEISQGRTNAMRKIFQDRAYLDEVEDVFAEFSTGTWRFAGYEVIRDRGAKKPYSWWETHGETSPPLQQLAMRLLSQVTSSSCCERNWSTYENLCSVKKSRLEQSRAETMVVELALANLDLNDPVLELVTFDDGDTLEESSSTPTDADITLDIEEENAIEESSGDHENDADFDD